MYNQLTGVAPDLAAKIRRQLKREYGCDPPSSECVNAAGEAVTSTEIKTAIDSIPPKYSDDIEALARSNGVPNMDIYEKVIAMRCARMLHYTGNEQKSFNIIRDTCCLGDAVMATSIIDNSKRIIAQRLADGTWKINQNN